MLYICYIYIYICILIQVHMLSWEIDVTVYIICKKNFMTPFYGWGSTDSRLEALWGGKLLLATKFPEIPGPHFNDLGRMKGWSTLSHAVILNTGLPGRDPLHAILLFYNIYINVYTQFTVKVCITHIWKKRHMCTVVYTYQNTCICCMPQ